MLPSTSTNRYGDMLKELYQGIKNGTLSETRMDDIQRTFNELHDREIVYKSWLQFGKADARFSKIIADGGYFGRIPVGKLYFERSDSVQSIPDNTETAISFDYGQGISETLRWDISDPTNIYLLNQNKSYAVMGAVQWDANGSGRRALSIEFFDAAGVSLGGKTLHSFKPEGTNNDVLPFAVSFFAILSDHFRVKAYQNSGGALDLILIELTIFEVE